MAQKVESFVSHVNSHLRQRQENERLKTIIARIDSYEPVVCYYVLLSNLIMSGHSMAFISLFIPGLSWPRFASSQHLSSIVCQR